MDNNIKMVPAICSQCGGTVEVNRSDETAKCPFCGASFIVEKAVNVYNVQHANIEHADNVNIDVTGAVKEVLDFAGNQMKEERKDRQERRRESAEREKETNKAFFKMFGFVFAGMMVFGLIAFIIMQFTGGNYEETQNSESKGSYIECKVENGCLYTEVTNDDVMRWEYQEFDSQGTVLSYEHDLMDGYSSCVLADHDIDEGVRFVVTAAFDRTDVKNDPVYYSVVKITIKNHEIAEAAEPVIVDSLFDYDFDQ